MTISIKWHVQVHLLSTQHDLHTALTVQDAAVLRTLITWASIQSPIYTFKSNVCYCIIEILDETSQFGNKTGHSPREESKVQF